MSPGQLARDGLAGTANAPLRRGRLSTADEVALDSVFLKVEGIPMLEMVFVCRIGALAWSNVMASWSELYTTRISGSSLPGPQVKPQITRHMTGPPSLVLDGTGKSAGAAPERTTSGRSTPRVHHQVC